MRFRRHYCGAFADSPRFLRFQRWWLVSVTMRDWSAVTDEEAESAWLGQRRNSYSLPPSPIPHAQPTDSVTRCR